MKPIRSSSKDPSHVMPGPARGCLSLFSLSWMTGLMWKACRNKLRPEDLWTLRTEDSCHTNYVRLLRLWRRELELRGAQNASLTMTLVRAFRTRIVISTLLMLISNSLALLGPSILLRQMIIYLNDQSAPVSRAVGLLVAMVVARFASVYFMAGAYGVTAVFTGARATGALQMLVYQKLLRLSAASDQMLGKVVNICINDMDRLSEALRIAAFVVSAICMTAYGFVVNLVYVGPWSLLGFSIIIMSFFVLGSFGGMMSVRRVAVVTITDRRVTFMSEILAAIRLIKMYAWEESFKKKIEDIRKEEMSVIKEVTFLQSMSNFSAPIIPILATAVSVIGYIASGNELRAAEAFTMFSVFNALQMAVGTLPYGIKMITETHVCLRRIQRLLLMKDIEVNLTHCDSGSAIEIVNATFAWERPVSKKGKSEKKREERSRSAKSLPRLISSPRLERRRRPASAELSLDADAATQTDVVLTGVNLSVPAGRLLGVAGSVGSGKTSLLVAMTGQLRVLCGDVRRAGTMAVVPQRAWIFSGTLRDNILFGRPMLPDLYQRTLTVCALRPDLALMEHGDLSEIGDRGVNLSGGQKQRVNLARAVYADADIYLMDDPLSAVDSSVGPAHFPPYLSRL
ncbi:multidrug resistance-associated protein 5-like [Pollicipes pollicipes]|uniref:multidrug resistance-associated protein 5-like n=1 Tax=Pollicipes pollicipes TaxID=41117 RepID=UPI0018851EAD|nr:multidrug resistance-associated protein 5-like [Pollicipes pollicipes]